MKNTGIKIIILAITIVLAFGGVLVFYRTIVLPPTDVDYSNLHITAIEKDINGFSETKNTTFNDSIYNSVVDKLSLYKTEEFLNADEIDYQTKALVQKYLPVFTKDCMAKFNASVWKEADHKAILKRIEHLRTLKVDYDMNPAVVGTFAQNLKDIEYIISRYGQAKQAAKYNTFYSVADANKKISTAESFRTEQYLSNCTDLVKKLSMVKVNIGNSHYEKVSDKVESLSGYRSMTEDGFKSLSAEANRLITEYNDNRSKYGTNAKTADGLKRDAGSYYTKAMAYYESLREPEITINTNGEWISMTSPNTSYRAYQSNSNWHRINQNAKMSFTIKGYESFTFYVRSDGESNYDYLLVKMGQVPTTDSYYASTKGEANSGTSFYNYRAVTFSNLSKSSEYTIYVVYRKDGSGDNGTDRGYVLIPRTE